MSKFKFIDKNCKMKSVLFYIILFQSIFIFSQEAPLYTQYTYNMHVLNPAYAGSRDALSINTLGKRQWAGIENSPKTATLAIHSPVNRRQNLGIGFSAVYDLSLIHISSPRDS